MHLRPVLWRTHTEMHTTVYHKTNLKVVLQASMGNYDWFLRQCTVLSVSLSVTVDFRVVCLAEHGRLCNNVTDFENWWGMSVLPECICHANGITLTWTLLTMHRRHVEKDIGKITYQNKLCVDCIILYQIYWRHWTDDVCADVLIFFMQAYPLVLQ